jgi:hypothetical protein
VKITFAASLPDILSAISLSGVQDSGARIKLDIPASDVGAVVLLQQKGAGKLLKVTIEVVEGKVNSMPKSDIDMILEGVEDSM